MVAACMLAGTTPVLTGCIDNDEPYGIEQLRGAKAELLKAKVAIAEAEALRLRAEAGRLDAEAAIKNAEARIKEALAQREEAHATMAEDSAEYISQLLNMKIEEERAKIDAAIAAQKQYQAEAEAAYMEALKDLALAQTTLSADQMEYLSEYTEAVDLANVHVKMYTKDFEGAQTTLTELYRVLQENELDTEHYRNLKARVQKRTARLQKKQEALAEMQEVRDLAVTNPDVNRWNEELQELQEKQDSLANEQSELYLLANKYNAEHKAERQEMIDSLAVAYAYGAGGNYIDENGNEQDYGVIIAGATSYGSNPFELKGEDYSMEWETGAFGANTGESLKMEITDATYKYDDYLNGQIDIANGSKTEKELDYIQPYTMLNDIADFRVSIEAFTLNANGEAWTTNDRAYAAEDTLARKNAYEDALAAWQEAVDAYQFAGTVTNPLEIEEGAALNEKINTYNTAAAAHKAAKDALNAARTKLTNTILGISIKRYNTAATAAPDYAPAATSTYADYTSVKSDVQTMISTLAGDVTTTKAEVDRLKALYTDPTASESALIAAAETNFTNATNILAAANSIVTALDTDKKALAGDGNIDSLTGGAEKTWKDAHDAAKLAFDQVTNAYTAYVNYFFNGASGDPLGNWSDIIKVRPDATPNILSADNYVTAMVNADVLEVSQDTLNDILKFTSEQVWGDINNWVNEDNDAFLVAPTEADFIANIKERYADENRGRELPDYLVQFYYTASNHTDYTASLTTSDYGAYGLYLASKAAYDRMDNYLKNGGEEIKAILADIDEKDALLRETLAANAKKVENLIAFFEEKNAAYNAAFAEEVGDKVAEVQAAQEIITPVLTALQNIIKGYVNTVVADNGLGSNADTLEKLIKRFDKEIRTLEQDVHDAQDKLTNAQEALARYEQLGGKVDLDDDGVADEYMKWAMEDAEAEYNEAKAKMEAAQQELADATAALEAAIQAVLDSANAAFGE